MKQSNQVTIRGTVENWSKASFDKLLKAVPGMTTDSAEFRELIECLVDAEASRLIGIFNDTTKGITTNEGREIQTENNLKRIKESLNFMDANYGPTGPQDDPEPSLFYKAYEIITDRSLILQVFNSLYTSKRFPSFHTVDELTEGMAFRFAEMEIKRQAKQLSEVFIKEIEIKENALTALATDFLGKIPEQQKQDFLKVLEGKKIQGKITVDGSALMISACFGCLKRYGFLTRKDSNSLENWITDNFESTIKKKAKALKAETVGKYIRSHSFPRNIKKDLPAVYKLLTAK